MPYLELQSLFDAARPARYTAMRSNFMANLPDAAIEVLVDRFPTTPSPLSAVIVEHCHGAIARVAPDATAFGLRRHPYHLEILGFWDGADQSPANLCWVTDFFGAMHPFDVSEVYVNSLDEGEGHCIRKSLRGKLRSPDGAQSEIRPNELLPLQSEHLASLSGGYIGARPAAR